MRNPSYEQSPRHREPFSTKDARDIVFTFFKVIVRIIVGGVLLMLAFCGLVALVASLAN